MPDFWQETPMLIKEGNLSACGTGFRVRITATALQQKTLLERTHHRQDDGECSARAFAFAMEFYYSIALRIYGS
jgi:hypothetical protein